jgi:hypothetical protein
MRGRNWVERILQRVLQRRLRTPGDMVELRHVFVIHETAAYVPDTYSIIDTEARALGCRKNMLPIWAPLAVGTVSRLDGDNFAIVLLKVVNVHMASQISKTSDKNKTAVGGEEDSIPGPKIKIVLGNSADVKDSSLCRHIAVHNAKFL